MERKNRCCIATCKGERFDLAHKFPRSYEIAESWLQAVDNPNLKTLNLRKLSECYQVCARHFRVSDYRHPQSRSLNKLAVPSLNLKDLSQLHLARDSTPRETEYALVAESNPKDQQTNDGILEHEDSDNVELVEIEYDEITSNDTPLGSINIPFDGVEQKKLTLKVTDFSTGFEIIHPNYEKPLYLNAFWLRFNCNCSDCFDSETKRKKFTLMDIPRNIQPKDITQLGTLDTLLIQWEDGHCSTHDVEFLFKMQSPKEKLFFEKLTFDANILKQPPQIEFSKLICFDNKIEKIFKNLILYGFVCVTGISTQNSSMATLAIQRLFPHHQTIKFEQFNEIHSDICTNCTCSNIDCGLKCFFATHKSEIILVDGLKVTEEFKQSDAYAFNKLTNTDVQLKMRDNSVYHNKSGPIINIDVEVEETFRIQLDTQRMGLLDNLKQSEIQSFYESLELFMTIIRNNKNQLILSLEPGTMIILDNWRVLHKLLSNVGVLQCYLSRNDYIGRSRYLGLL